MFSSIWPSKPPNDRLQQASTMESPQHKSLQDAKEELEQQFIGLPVPLVALIFFGLGFACSTGGALLYARYGRRIRNTDWIVPDYFEKNRWIRGVVTRYVWYDVFYMYIYIYICERSLLNFFFLRMSV